MKDECTFISLNFLIIGLRNSFANSLLEMFSSLIADLFRVAKVSGLAGVSAPSDVSYQKIYKPLKQVHIDVRHILDF